MSNARVPVIDPTNPFEGQETWRNTSKGKVYVKKFTGIYGEMTQICVHGGQTVHLTPAERRVNMEAAYNADQDPFRNGRMVAVRLIESEADVEELRSNPQAVTDDEIRDALTHHQKLTKLLARITNPVTLERILEIAMEGDGVGIKLIERIQARQAECDPTIAARLAAEQNQDAQPAMTPDGAQRAPQPADIYDNAMFAGGTTAVG